MAASKSWSSLICGECNKEFMEKKDMQKHYKSEWHRYNLKRKMAGYPGVTEAVFLAKRSAPTLDTNTCGKEYTCSKAYAQHLKSRPHSVKIDDSGEEEYDEVDPTCCFMCDQKHKSIESCMIHMHKIHGLFIPDIEFLKDPRGLLKYLGEKVKHEYTCLYCNVNCQPFESLEAVRMHMVAKSHCRVHYGDATDELQEPELDEFYDYSTSYVNGDGKQLVTSDSMSNSITLGCGGSELVITKATDEGGVSTKALGSREYLRYYRQKPRPSSDSVPVTSLQAAKYRSISLSTVQLKEKMERMKLMNQIMKNMNRSGAEAMRCKMSTRSNPIRPMNVIH